jgi:hypothetical protein
MSIHAGPDAEAPLGVETRFQKRLKISGSSLFGSRDLMFCEAVVAPRLA